MAYVATYTTLLSSFLSYVERTDDARVEAEFPTFLLFAQRRIARECKILGLQKYATSTFTAANGVIQKPARWLKTLSINFGTSNGEAISTTVTAGGTEYANPLVITSTGGGASTQATWRGFTVNGVVTQIVPLTRGVGYTSAPTLAIAGANSTGSGATATATVSTTNIERRFMLERSYEFCRSYWPTSTQTSTPKFYSDYDFNYWLIVPTPATAWPFEIAYYELAEPIDTNNETNWLTENAPDMLLTATIVEAAPFLKWRKEQTELWETKYQTQKSTFLEEDRGRFTDRTAERGA